MRNDAHTKSPAPIPFLSCPAPVEDATAVCAVIVSVAAVLLVGALLLGGVLAGLVVVVPAVVAIGWGVLQVLEAWCFRERLRHDLFIARRKLRFRVAKPAVRFARKHFIDLLRREQAIWGELEERCRDRRWIDYLTTHAEEGGWIILSQYAEESWLLQMAYTVDGLLPWEEWQRRKLAAELGELRARARVEAELETEQHRRHAPPNGDATGFNEEIP